MPRQRERPFLDQVFELLKVTPSWVGPILAVVIFAVFRFVLPALIPAPQAGVDAGVFMRPFFSLFSWLLGTAVLVAWVMAEVWKLANRRLLDSQTGLASIRGIPWQAFERLVCEAYRRKGYLAEVTGNASGDGGVDIRLSGQGQKVLVQCKQWKAYKVGVTAVRELLGVVVSEKADRGVVVTSGRFTQEAKAFAGQNPQIELVDGPRLAELIRDVQAAPAVSAPPASAVAPAAASQPPACPQCGSPMLLRTARKGQNAGSQFWGCPRYPACRGKRELEAVGAARG